MKRSIKAVPFSTCRKFENIQGYYIAAQEKNVEHSGYITDIDKDYIYIYDFWTGEDMRLSIADNVAYKQLDLDELYDRYPEKITAFLQSLQEERNVTWDAHTMFNAFIGCSIDELARNYIDEDPVKFEIFGLSFNIPYPHTAADGDILTAAMIVKLGDDDELYWCHIRDDIARDLQLDAATFLRMKGKME